MKLGFDFGSKNINLPHFNVNIFLDKILPSKDLRSMKPLFYTYQIYKYIVFYPFLGFFTAFFVIVGIVEALLINTETRQVWARLWARFNSYITPMFVTLEGTEKIDKNQSYVIVANHQSQYDIFAVYGWLPVDFRWVMKIQLRNVPLIGYYCYRAGHIFIDRSSTESAISSINKAKQMIKDGVSILFFPEGTRSNDENLKEFKKGAFKLALDMGLPILPITISGTREILPSNTTDLFPGKAKIIIHKPIPITEYNNDNIDELKDRSRQVIQKGLE